MIAVTQEARLITALDGMDLEHAISLTTRLSHIPGHWGIKGNALFRRHGYPVISIFRAMGVRVMADLKLHDIKQTGVNDAAFLGPFQPDLVTVHASGGVDMVKAIVNELEQRSGGVSKVLTITLLTSLSADDCDRIYGTKDKDDVIRRLATVAEEAGAYGVVCSPQELPLMREEFPNLVCVTPGIRPAGSAADDQKRVGTPRAAIEGGAEYLVVGRPIVEADDPVTAAQEIVKEIESA
jgi:orotidine-5'-phosphate decarboxylase